MTTAAEQQISTTVIDRGVLPTTEVIARMHRIQEVMKAVMKEGTHYGTIPGTPKPTLYKAGAELLLVTFRIAATPANIEDLSTPDEVRYRVTMRGTNQVTGEIVGEMVGECSSSETKYRWVKPVCDEEWNETDPMMRREKWFKGYGDKPAYKAKQIRSSPADVANTILSMAAKRGLIALTRVCLSVSDVFAQNLEDLTEELRESLLADEAPKPETKQPQRRSATGTAAPAAKPLPNDAKVVTGVIGKVFEDKKPYALYLKDNQAKYTTFDDSLWGDVRAFVGTTHKIRLAYTETVKGTATYFNIAGVSIADAEPVMASAAPATTAPLRSDDIFGDRQPGEDG